MNGCSYNKPTRIKYICVCVWEVGEGGGREDDLEMKWLNLYTCTLFSRFIVVVQPFPRSCILFLFPTLFLIR